MYLVFVKQLNGNIYNKKYCVVYLIGNFKAVSGKYHQTM